MGGFNCLSTPQFSCTKNAENREEGTNKAHLAAMEERMEDIKPGLREIMSVIQQHHAKLYYAGREENWELADYQLDEIKEGLESAAKFYPQFKNVKASLKDLIPAMTKNDLDGVSDSIKNKNKIAFVKHFESLTVSCNRCHQAAEHQFIVIKVPSGSEFTNQKFTK